MTAFRRTSTPRGPSKGVRSSLVTTALSELSSPSMQVRSSRLTLRRGFSLIELLTVMAISAILLTIIAIPVVQSLNLTRAAQSFAAAQDRARSLMGQIEREIENAAGVRDNTGLRGSLAVIVPGQSGDVRLLLPNTKLDIIKPASGDPASRVGTAYIDPDTRKVDPTLRAPKGQATLPGGQGETIVRYFIALRDPFGRYTNPWSQIRNITTGFWGAGAGGRDNLYVLFRAEVQPYIWVTDPVTSQPIRVVNTQFFIDGSRDGDPTTPNEPIFDDPDFMIPRTGPAANLPYATAQPWDPADRNQMIRNWVNRATVVTETSRFDMIMPEFDRASGRIVFFNGEPRITPLVRFQPTFRAGETAVGETAVRAGEESINMAKIGADVFRTQFGSWANVGLRIYPSFLPTSYNALGQSSGNPRGPWQTGTPTVDLLPNSNGGQSLFLTGGTEMFDVSEYRDLKARGADYPFSQSLVTLNGVGVEGMFVVVPEPEAGRVTASFSVQEVGSDTSVPFDLRGPSTGGGPGIASGSLSTPAQPAFQTGPAWNTYVGFNDRFSRLWNQWDSLWPNPSLAPGRESVLGPRRFVDLRVTPQAGIGNAPGPLSPTFGWRRVSITPGSEVVFGPDQTPGPNFGRIVRYTRVPNVDTVSVGPNQYKINYTDQVEPNWAEYGFTSPQYSPQFYNGSDFLSAVLQARYRAGYLELNSRYGEPIPGNIFVTYRFQFTEPNDVVAVSYDSTDMMEVILTVRNFAPGGLPTPQMTTLRGAAAVRNTIR